MAEEGKRDERLHGAGKDPQDSADLNARTTQSHSEVLQVLTERRT
jgi:hypothetical protein